MIQMAKLKLNPREQEILDETIGVLRHRLNPDKVILFGSRAKGTAHPGSDFDFAVDMPEPEGKLRRRVEGEIEAFCGLYTVDIVYLQSVESDFRNVVLSTGKVVYER